MDKRDMRRSRGFSLLELLIVVAIILIIVTIAIPNVVRSRQSAQEASAVATLKQIHAAEILYMSSNRGSFGDLAGLAASGELDDRFAEGGGSPVLNGYRYSVVLSGPNNSEYYIQADPVSTTSGRYDYYSGVDGVVRYRTALGGRVPGAPVSQ